MISFRLLLACLFWAGLGLFIVELILHILEKQLGLLRRIPSDLLEEPGAGLFVSKFVMQFAFLVTFPAVAYSWFYVLVPFSGIRAGMALALVLFLMGIIPFTVTLLMRIRFPVSYTLFQLAGQLIKLMVVYGIISYLYVL